MSGQIMASSCHHESLRNFRNLHCQVALSYRLARRGSSGSGDCLHCRRSSGASLALTQSTLDGDSDLSPAPASCCLLSARQLRVLLCYAAYQWATAIPVRPLNPMLTEQCQSYPTSMAAGRSRCKCTFRHRYPPPYPLSTYPSIPQ